MNETKSLHRRGAKVRNDCMGPISRLADIFFSEVKEPNYFAPDLPGIRWVSSLSAYEHLFRRGSSATMLGEASAMYLYSEQSAERIRQYNPDSRILIFLRPQEHFLPSYHHQLLFRFADDIHDFETAWRLSGSRARSTIPKTCREPKLLNYASVADFRTQVERYLNVFPAEQVMVINFAKWTSDPRSTYLEILEFLGLKDDGRIEFPRMNEAKSYRVKWVGKLIAKPPRSIQLVVNLLKKITGRDSLGLGVKAAELMSTQGYTTSVSQELREEIRRHYEDDNRVLSSLIDKCWRGQTSTATH